jgi:large subunit ribosomal protein L35
MPKMKAHKGLAKRVRVSASGKVRHKKINAGHLMSGKTGARKRRLRQTATMYDVLAKKARRALLA